MKTYDLMTFGNLNFFSSASLITPISSHRWMTGIILKYDSQIRLTRPILCIVSQNSHCHFAYMLFRYVMHMSYWIRINITLVEW